MTPTPHDDDFLPDDRVSAYLDDELTAAERVAFEADLARDPTLRAELEQVREAIAFLGDHGPLAAPADLLDDILAATAEEKVVSLAWYRRPFGIPLEGLAVAAAALLVIYVALPSRPVATTPQDAASGRAAPVQTVAKQATKSTTKKAPLREEQTDRADGVAVVDDPAERTDDAEAWADRKLRKADAKPLDKARPKGVDDFELPAKGADQAVGGLAGAKGAKDATAEPSADAKGPTPLFSQVPYSYAIDTTDPEVLARLAALAARYSGELKDGEALVMEELSANDAATVLVKIPSHALRDFGRSLGALGTVSAIADNAVFAGDPVEVRVSVRLRSGAGTADVKKAAPVKQAAPMKKAPSKATTSDLDR
jgi:hypothetical protein